MRSLQRPINDGGIKFPNPITYCDLFYISKLFQYFKTREKNTPFNTESYLIEFEIGLTLSKMYNLPKLNYIAHRDHSTPFYQKTIQILKQYKISLQELTKEKLVKSIIDYPTLTNALLTKKLFVGNSLPQVSSRTTSRPSIIEQSVIFYLLALNQVNVHCACNFRIRPFTCLPNAV